MERTEDKQSVVAVACWLLLLNPTEKTEGEESPRKEILRLETGSRRIKQCIICIRKDVTASCYRGTVWSWGVGWRIYQKHGGCLSITIQPRYLLDMRVGEIIGV